MSVNQQAWRGMTRDSTGGQATAFSNLRQGWTRMLSLWRAVSSSSPDPLHTPKDPAAHYAHPPKSPHDGRPQVSSGRS